MAVSPLLDEATMRGARTIWVVGVVVVTLTLAFYVHQRHTWVANPTKACAGQAFPTCAGRQPSWENPAALLIAVGGLAITGCILVVANRRIGSSARPLGARAREA